MGRLRHLAAAGAALALLSTLVATPAGATPQGSGSERSSGRPGASPRATQPPGPVQQVRLVSVSSRTVVLSWARPQDPTPVEEYRVRFREAGTSSWNRKEIVTQITTATVSGLTNDTAYEFAVAAVNDRGPGTYVALARPVTPKATAPAPPADVRGQVGNEFITVSWSAPDNGGSAITSYVVTSKPGNKTCETKGTRRCRVEGLTNGTLYTFTVRATNGIGTSKASDPSPAVMPGTTPGQPRSVTAEPFNTRIDVFWLAPQENGGYPITSYTATASPGGAQCTSVASTRTCSILGLSNGREYSITVVAFNDIGRGPVSNPPAKATPRTVPTSPTNVTATRGNQQAVVQWTAATAPGSPAITSYTVTSNPGGLTCQPATLTTSCVVTGLTNGVRYTFTVVATNLVGNSAPSAPSPAVTPATVPSAPLDVTGEPKNQGAVVTWRAPASTGGDPIESYLVTSSPEGKTCVANAPLLSCLITGLTNNKPYTFTVIARNTVGPSVASQASSNVIPRTVPPAPTGIGATPGNTTASVSWTASAVPVGHPPVTSYTATSSPDGRQCTTSGLSCTVEGLRNGVTYTFTVTSLSSIGTSLPSDPSPQVIPAGPPSAPAITRVARGNTTATVGFSVPSSNGGRPITGYTVTANPGGRTCSTLVTDQDPLTCTVTGLTNGRAYTFTVTASNERGTSSASAASSPVTPATRPDAPTDVRGEARAEGAEVFWTAPVDDGGSPVTGYTVTTYSTDGDQLQASTCTATGTATSCTVPGLTNFESYYFEVIATNDVDDSDPSAPTGAVIPLPAPDAPVFSGEPERASTQVTLAWSEPLSEAPITGYTVTATPGGRTCTTRADDAEPLTCTVTGLTNGQSYTFTVTATSSVGTSLPSAPSDPVVPATVPNPPRAHSASRATPR